MIEATKQALSRYFDAGATDFADLPLDLQGTPFQLRVWQELRQIPRGRAISYKELARRAGSPQASRAVGQANGRNPVPIIVPCHRVIAADGSLGGYSSGLDKKRWLLNTKGRCKDGFRWKIRREAGLEARLFFSWTGEQLRATRGSPLRAAVRVKPRCCS